ncbi:MAG: hypothetical protein J0M12_11555 [Deltaproteobacteria bacterium]|nr:hypothetical protein [Deltaproteobacteria bacterium]
MTDVSEKIADFHVRLGRLETLVEVQKLKKQDSRLEDAIELITALAALGFCYFGFGLPNHYYQYVFAILIVGALYHREVFPRPRYWYDWIQILVNCLVLSMLLKLIIGGGDPRPFNWLSYPVLEGNLTSLSLSWQQTDMAKWALPLTVIQTFFLVMTLFGSLIGFELFCGLTSFILIILAVPALVSFNWTWALPGMIAALFCFYLQADGESL